MIIGIDAREIQEGIYTGIGRALDVFLEYFAGQNDEHRVILFSAKPVNKKYGKRVTNITATEKITFLWDQYTLPRLIKKHPVDLFYSPYYKIPLFCSVPCVSSIYDLIYLNCDYYRKEIGLFSKIYYYTIAKRMAHRAKRIVTISEFSKSDTIKAYHVDAGKIDVIYLAVDPVFRRETNTEKIERIKQKYAISGNYCLYVGNFKPHKNVDTLILAFSKILKKLPDLKLVLSGGKGSHLDKLLKTSDDSGITANIRTTGRISIDEQVLLYSGASVLVMPSLYEGFGYPPLEAMACGTPVVSSSAASLPEIVGDAGILVQPENADTMADAMIKILESPDFAKELSEKGVKHAENFTNENTSGKLYELLKKVGETQ